jgi:hypothetical protein
MQAARAIGARTNVSSFSPNARDDALRKLLALQDGYASVTNSEITHLLTNVKENLVLNLSDVPLSPEATNVLERGVQFIPTSVRPCKKTALSLVDTFTNQIATRLHGVELETVPGYSRSHGSAHQAGHPVFNAKLFRPKLSVRPVSDLDFGLWESHQCIVDRLRASLLRNVHTSCTCAVSNLTAGEDAALRLLTSSVKQHDVVVRKADKSRQIVVLSHEQYVKGVFGILSDVRNYEQVEFNGKYRAAALIRRAVAKASDSLGRRTSCMLLQFTTSPRARLLYCLPKTHKPRERWTEGVPPFRPICPDTQTESSASGQFLAQFLAPFFQRLPSFIKNSYELVELLEQLDNLPDSATLVTADIDNLYPNIPIQEAMECFRDIVSSLPDEQVSSELKALLLALMDVHLNTNYFEFEDRVYKQIRGIPMGRAWAPALASLYLDRWDRTILSRLARPPLLYKRYIDDVLFVFDNEGDARLAVSIMNDVNPNIKLGDFAVSSRVHFLDLSLEVRLVPDASRTLPSLHAPSQHARIHVELYRKPSDLIVLVHLHSATPMSVKIGAILGQMMRIVRLTTDVSTAGRNIRFLLESMRLRGLNYKLRVVLWRRLLTWYAKRLLPDAGESAASAKVPICVLRVPPLYDFYRFRQTVRALVEELPARERRYVGRIAVRLFSGRPLARILFAP